MNFSPSPSGARIRDQIGGRYLLLPKDGFECKWHRRHETSDSTRARAEKEGTWWWLPCEQAEAWGAPVVRGEALDGLSFMMLPDGRQVAVIPAVERIGTVSAAEWTRVKTAARNARGPVLRHAYLTSKRRFQRWQKIGPEALQTIHDGERALEARTSDLHPESRLAYEDRGLANWIFVHGRALFCSKEDSEQEKAECIRRIVVCTPHKMAYAAMEAATGYTEKAIDSAVHRTGKGHSARNAIASSDGSEQADFDEDNDEW